MALPPRERICCGKVLSRAVVAVYVSEGEGSPRPGRASRVWFVKHGKVGCVFFFWRKRR